MNMKYFRIILTGLMLFGFFILFEAPFISAPQFACAEDAWKTEFEDICSKTNDAMALNKEEVKALIDRCDKLKSQIEKLDETARKVYLKRLQMCRDLFVFVRDSKEKN